MRKTRKGYPVYPLTAAQKLHYYCLKYCPKKQVLNIGSSLTIEQDLDWNLLKEAIYQAYDRCESMRLRFTEDKEGNVYQYVADREERDIEHFDFTGWQECHAREKLEEWTQTPFDTYDCPRNRVVMIKMPDGFQGVYLLVDHLTMDAQSLIVFLKDVIELYCHMKYEGIDEPKPMASYLKQLEKDLAYEAGSDSQKRDREFFEKRIAASEPVFADIFGMEKLKAERKALKNPKMRAATNTSDNVEANITTFHLEAEPSMELLDFCEKNRVSMVCLLMMGLRTYLQKENNEDDISITTTIARRATLSEKKCGGSRIHCFPFRTTVPREDTFLEGVLKIRDEQNQYFRHANYNPVDYYGFRQQHYGLKNGQTYEALSLTYQPMSLKTDGLERLGDIRYQTERYTNGVAAHTLYLTVMHRAADNGLDFSFEYQTGVVTPEKLESIYYYLCRILFCGVRVPEAAVGTIIEEI